MRPALRRGLGAAALLLPAVAGLVVFHYARRIDASLPHLDGELPLAGLVAPATVRRDARGVPTLGAEDRLDLARATGFVHAQDRFFQMDLLRRSAAGELAELLGESALQSDLAVRPHLLRRQAAAAWDAGSPAMRRLLTAYAEGVAAGLASLDAPPFEYVLLGAEPRPWSPRDSLLVIYAMYLRLQDEAGDYDAGRGVLAATLEPDLLAFLWPEDGGWEAPLPELAARSRPAVEVPHPVPRKVARRPRPPRSALPGDSPPPVVRAEVRRPARPRGGSNVWALSGAHTADGAAWLANDMHLALGLPTTWYRAVLEWSDAAGAHRLTGVTLPGVPLLVAGSNGRVAWGLANAQVDTTDVVRLSLDPSDPDAYLTAEGPRPFRHLTETVRVAGGNDVSLDVRWSRWGPVMVDAVGLRAVRWVAHEPGAADLGFAGLETASDVGEALAVARSSGVPAQSFITVDAAGSIGWTVAGALPRRLGNYDAGRPVDGRRAGRLWDGRLGAAEVPAVVDPPSGRLWAANNRLVTRLPEAARLGDGGYDLGARACQIRDGLAALEAASPADLLALQLDDRALFLERWRRLLLDLLRPEVLAGEPRRRELRRLVDQGWSGRALPASAAYRLVRGFRLTAAEELLGELTAPSRRLDPRLDLLTLTGVWEAPLWHLVDERPPELLAAGFASWEERLLALVDSTLDYYLADGEPLAGKTWGAANALRLRHPLAGLPVVGDLLHLELDPMALPGDQHMPRVQTPSAGASERLVVSPGREGEGVFQLPGGQSGHPHSPFFRDGVEAWASGRPTPLLPGETIHTLRLVPAG